MTLKDRANKLLILLSGHLKPLFTAVIILAILQVTGLRSQLNEMSQSALMLSGFYDTSGEALAGSEDFHYQFTIKDLQGHRLPFDKFRGKVVFLNLWATWCTPCRAEMKGIQKLYEKVKKDSIVFVMLSIDKDRDKGKIEEYIRVKGFNFPVYQPSGYLTQQLNVPEIPTTFIISREGKIVKKEIGSKNFDNAKFEKYLKNLSQ